MQTGGAIVQNQYIRKTEKVNGVLQNTVVETYPLTNQFWPLDPEKYLAQPVYSRDFPACKYCK